MPEATEARPAARFPDSLDPRKVWIGATNFASIATTFMANWLQLKKSEKLSYPRDQMNADSKLVRREGWTVVAAAKVLGVDAGPLIAILTNDRLWEWPDEKEDFAIFRNAAKAADAVMVEARVECALRGLHMPNDSDSDDTWSDWVTVLYAKPVAPEPPTARREVEHETTRAMRDLIDAKPGLIAKEIGKAIGGDGGVSESHVRRIYSLHLKKLGYTNGGAGKGYYPPAKP